jgi:hypothetical protein
MLEPSSRLGNVVSLPFGVVSRLAGGVCVIYFLRDCRLENTSVEWPK